MSSSNEGIIFSINALTIKNNEYLQQIRELVDGMLPLDFDYERYIAEVGFGDKIIKTNVVEPDVAKITLKNVDILYDRIAENCIAIKKLAEKLEKTEFTPESMAQWKLENGF